MERQGGEAALAIRGGTVVAMDADRTVGAYDVLVDRTGRIDALVERGAPVQAARTIDAAGRVIVPGLVQAHVHLCQTLFRGLAEQRGSTRWLRERIWPLEAALDADALRASARLGVAELLLGGTTAVLDMGTVHHTDVLFEVAAETGVRYTGGKALLDAGEGVPPGLLDDTAAALRESDRLAQTWHGAESGRLRYAHCPWSVLTSSWDLLRSVGARVRANDLMVHAHASEQRSEAELVQQRFHQPAVRLLASVGLAGSNACLAHCVSLDASEVDVLARGGASVAHCPSRSLKLGAGIPPIATYLERGINVGLGADGAASNNRLDGWEELRLASLLANVGGAAETLPAREMFELATLGGARALGLEREIGRLEPGKWADLAILDLRAPHAIGPRDVYTQLVFSARADDVRTVVVGGRVLVEERTLRTLGVASVVQQAVRQRGRVARRAGLRADAAER